MEIVVNIEGLGDTNGLENTEGVESVEGVEEVECGGQGEHRNRRG